MGGHCFTPTPASRLKCKRMQNLAAELQRELLPTFATNKIIISKHHQNQNQHQHQHQQDHYHQTPLSHYSLSSHYSSFRILLCIMGFGLETFCALINILRFGRNSEMCSTLISKTRFSSKWLQSLNFHQNIPIFWERSPSGHHRRHHHHVMI